MMVFMPTPIGLQDIAALIARQPFVSDSVRQRLASPFGTIHAATFTMPRPLGTAIPQIPLYTLASFDPADPEITGSIGKSSRFLGAIDPESQRIYPTVNRTTKGDRLAPASAESVTAHPDTPAAEPDEAPGEGSALEDPATPDISLSLELRPQLPIALPPDQPTMPVVEAPQSEVKAAAQTEGTPDFSDESAVVTGNIFFGSAPLGGAADRIEPWAPGTKIVLESPDANDPDLKRPTAAVASVAPSAGETVASKGEVTGEGKRPRTPAERLSLIGRDRAKAEKCLTDAVYFESRGEPRNGQIAVAQVVMNRVFSGFYPTTVCGVVYQNAHRRLACQFTFACDGIPDRVTEPDAWALAKQIARDTLDGKLWLKHVGKSTHYHAYWVRPRWVSEMMKLHKLGVHTFYRPRAWGDGAEAPTWGDAAKPDGKTAETTGTVTPASEKM
jgi:spore germination cell wall hydrolase CwlJ-like protein